MQVVGDVVVDVFVFVVVVVTAGGGRGKKVYGFISKLFQLFFIIEGFLKIFKGHIEF